MIKKTTPNWRAVALVAQAFVLVACGGSNEPSTMNVTTGTPGSAGAAGTTGTAGAAPAAGTAGAGTAGATSTGSTAADTQLCYKTCGPQSVGFKSETCTNGAYVEQSGCNFPKGMDYSCYKVPTAIDA